MSDLLDYIENEWGNFLDKDHKFSLDTAVHIINKEIIWCNQNPEENFHEFRRGFIYGLEQAKYLIINMAIEEYFDE